MRTFALVALMLLPLARTSTAAAAPTGDRVQSRCGRHAITLERGEVRFDGRAIALDPAAEVLAAPKWRSDCRAVAWLDRSPRGARLVVVTVAGRDLKALSWSVPALRRDRIFWAGKTTVTVGADLLKPRAVARWT